MSIDITTSRPAKSSALHALLWIWLGIIAAAVIYSGAWLGAAVLLRHQAQRWLEARRADGVEIAYGEPTFNGYPTKVWVTFPAFSAAIPTEAGKLIWQTTSIRVTGTPFVANRLTIDLSGSHTLSGPAPLPLSPLLISNERADLLLEVDKSGMLTRARLAATHANASWGSDVALGQLDDMVLEFVQDPATADSSRLNVDADNVALPDIVPPPLGRNLKRVHLVADVKGPVGHGPLPQVLEAWRAAGGTAELREFVVDWPPLSVAGSGTLALDGNLQPEGALTARFRGFFDAVDVLVEKQIVRSSDAAMARIVLGLLAKSPPGGGPPELSLAVTAQDQKLHAGPITLMEIPRIEWPKNAIVP